MSEERQERHGSRNQGSSNIIFGLAHLALILRKPPVCKAVDFTQEFFYCLFVSSSFRNWASLVTGHWVRHLVPRFLIVSNKAIPQSHDAGFNTSFYQLTLPRTVTISAQLCPS
jgi:hypothetical protein